MSKRTLAMLTFRNYVRTSEKINRDSFEVARISLWSHGIYLFARHTTTHTYTWTIVLHWMTPSEVSAAPDAPPPLHPADGDKVSTSSHPRQLLLVRQAQADGGNI